MVRVKPHEIDGGKLITYILYAVGFMFAYKMFKNLAVSTGLFPSDEQANKIQNDKAIQDEIRKNTAVYRFKDGSVASAEIINSDAQAVADALGTTSMWYVWEDESKAYGILQKYTPETYILLRTSYNGISLAFQSTKDLTSDLKKYMDSYLQKIKYLWNE